MKDRSSYRIPIEIPGLRMYRHPEKFPLESGEFLEQLHMAYHIFGDLEKHRNNIIWVCHALTANSDVSDWWKGLFGPGKLLDPDQACIICANIIGSCYGSTGPRSVNPANEKPYGIEFPLITIRDWAWAHAELCRYLGIERISLCIGGSCGGHQVLEFTLAREIPIQKMLILATSARETPYVIAIHEAQRMAIEADPSWDEDSDLAGSDGMRAARAMALVHYRSFAAYQARQSDAKEKLDVFRAASYVRYQGEKLNRRFYGQCYWHLLKSLDTHNIARGRGDLKKVLAGVDIPALIIGISSDQLIPLSEQQLLAEHIPLARLEVIHSEYGHDGFLTEVEKINRAGLAWMSETRG